MVTNFLIFSLPILIGAAFALIIGVLVLPKVECASSLPMPPLHSYILGHALHFLDVRHLLAVQMKWFRELGDVFQLWLVHRRVVVTANTDDVKAVLSRTDYFARPPAQTALFNDLQPDNFQTMPRHVHKKHRSRMRDAFSSKNIEAFSNTVTTAIDDLLQRLRERVLDDPKASIDFTPELADTTFRVLLEAILGSKMSASDRATFAQESRAFLTEMLIEYCTYPLRRVFAFLGVRRRLFRQHRIVQQFASTLVDRRHSESADEASTRPFDMLDVILELDPTDRSRQVSNVTMFAIAGFESSSEALAWALYEISGRPDVAKKIQAEVDSVLGTHTAPTYDDVQRLTYLQQVWRETLRMHPAAGFLLRVATRDAVLPGSGVTVPAGVQVGALVAGAQRHPDFVDEPNAFRPERWANGGVSKDLLAFSCGPERCPGRPLADFECVAILGALYHSFDVHLGCARGEVRGISDWTERARTRAPGMPADDTSWSLPVRLSPRLLTTKQR